jgi:hypothetical protein
MSDKKLLFKFDSEWQARPVVELLRSHDIQVSEITTPREYSAIVTGIGHTGVSLYVDENQLNQAQNILLEFLQRSKIQLVTDDSTSTNLVSHKNFFRRVMFFSFAGMFFLPIIFNVIAALNLRGLFKHEPSVLKKSFAVTCFCLGWIVAGFELYWIAVNYLIKF